MTRKILALALALLLCVSLLAGCSTTKTPDTETPNTETPNTETPSVNAGGNENANNDTPLVVGYREFSSKFSPFFGDTGYDIEATELTQQPIVLTDRVGGVVYDAINGETISYNGTDYNYKGICDLKVTKGADTTEYLFTLRDGVMFSDGKPVTTDDIIFSLYVFCDPTYAGSTTLNALPIVGLQNYRTQTTDAIYDKYNTLFDEIYGKGATYTLSGSEDFTQEMYDAIWGNWWNEFGQQISNTVATGYASYALDALGIDSETYANDGWIITGGMALWGFGEFDVDSGVLTDSTGKTYDTKAGVFPTASDYGAALFDAYEGDAMKCAGTEDDGFYDAMLAELRKNFISDLGSKDPDMGAQGIPNIEGIKKVGTNQVSVTTNGYDSAAVYRLAIYASPLHYYGDASLYDYDNNKFGFPYGDLSSVEAKTTQPMGCGPYKFIRYENKVIYYEANEYYWRGVPKTKYLQLKVTLDPDKVSAVGTGSLDITDPSFSKDAVDEIKSYNSNGELNGDTITVDAVDNLGYGYIGLNADTVNVNGEPASEASKNLRKAFATVFASFRELTVDSYYGERASVINYPISNTSWAAPQKTDQGYRVAYSLDVDGKDIFTSSMSADQKYDAALNAAVGFLKAAGFTFDDASGKFTAAPAGAKLSYEVIIPGEGTSDHPSFVLLDEAKKAFEKIGIELIINNPANSNVLWDKMDAGAQEMWCAAWGATMDPDMYQVYHSSGIVGKGGSDSNHYHIADATLDNLIVEARTSDDQSFRKSTYKAALDVVLDWGVEIPVYQRQNCIIFSTQRVNVDTITPDITPFWVWILHDMELVEMN